MNLHQDIKLFSNILRATSQHLGIKLEFIEKDYWISLVLINNFDSIWNQLKDKYNIELSALAYRSIPDEEKIAAMFRELIIRIAN